MFRLFPDEAEVASYHSRSSLISLMSPPLDVDDTGVEWPSNFARRCVLADFRKTFFDELEAAAPDLLIIDLMSERFDLYRAPGTFVTRSWDLVDSGLDARCEYRLERAPRESDATQAAWCEHSREFAGVLRSRFPGLPVILHKASWTPRYRDGRAIRRFPRNWRSRISRRNELLEACHAQLEQVLPGLATVEPRRPYVADAGHRWGLGTSHYEPGYYEDLRAQLLSTATVLAA